MHRCSANWKLKLTRIRLVAGLPAPPGTRWESSMLSPPHPYPFMVVTDSRFRQLKILNTPSILIHSSPHWRHFRHVSPSPFHSTFKNHIFHKSLTPTDCWHLPDCLHGLSNFFLIFFHVNNLTSFVQCVIIGYRAEHCTGYRPSVRLSVPLSNEQWSDSQYWRADPVF